VATRAQGPLAAAGIFDPVCGIVGYVGRRVGGNQLQELLLEGLSRLEYRGYDSAGISMIADGRIDAVRAVGNLSALRAKLD
jgi:glutamine---fructose-6-phosphate transaminase (isomerizing)